MRVSNMVDLLMEEVKARQVGGRGRGGLPRGVGPRGRCEGEAAKRRDGLIRLEVCNRCNSVTEILLAPNYLLTHFSILISICYSVTLLQPL